MLKNVCFLYKFHYFFNFGSIASVKPSPIKLKTVTVIKIAKPGKIANHQAEGFARLRFNNFPQVIVSTGTPIPKKDKNASAKIAPAIPKATEINTGDKAFGRA